MQKGEINSSEMETQEYTYDKAEDLVSSKKAKLKGSSLGYTTNMNMSDINLASEQKKTEVKANVASPKSDEEDVFVKDQFEMTKALRRVIH